MKEELMYMCVVVSIAQMLGGIVANAVLAGLTPGKLNVQLELGKDVNCAQGVFIEMFTTANLVLSVLMLGAGESIYHKGFVEADWSRETPADTTCAAGVCIYVICNDVDEYGIYGHGHEVSDCLLCRGHELMGQHGESIRNSVHTRLPIVSLDIL